MQSKKSQRDNTRIPTTASNAPSPEPQQRPETRPPTEKRKQTHPTTASGAFKFSYNTPLVLERSPKRIVRRKIAVVGVGVVDITDLPQKQVPYRVTSHKQAVAFWVCHADLSCAATNKKVDGDINTVEGRGGVAQEPADYFNTHCVYSMEGGRGQKREGSTPGQQASEPADRVFASLRALDRLSKTRIHLHNRDGAVPRGITLS